MHDYGEDGAHGPFLVCEWVRGEDLRVLAGRLGPVPPEAAMVLAWELARALSAAHAVGIVHRDVKPENVLVAEGGPLKLADFGLAALEDQERLTSTGAVTGSLPYMAPERIDTGAYSSASDVYAVGVILFELCSGTTPHAGKGAAHLAASVMTKDAPSLTESVPGTPEALASLVARCLARDARDRPRDGAVLAAALEELLLKQVGPPAEVVREFFGNPVAVAAKWRRGRFERLLEEGRGLLARGEGARAAKVFNAALVMEPGSAEVMALLREGPKRPRGWKGGAIAAGMVGCAVVGWGGWTLSRSSEGLGAGPVSPAAMQMPVGVEEAGSPRRAEVPPRPPDAVKVPAGTGRELGTHAPASPPREEASGVETSEAGPSSAFDGAETQGAPVGPRHSARSGESSGSGKAPASGSTGRMASEARERVKEAERKPEPAKLPRTSFPGSAPSAGPASATPSDGVQAQPAVLKVTSRPWAEVFVNGESRGYTPRVRELSLPAGTHQLRFVNPLCDEVDIAVTLVAGETVARDVVLTLRKAEVAIHAPVGARLFVDGREVGTAPLPGPVSLEHGKHRVSAHLPGATPVQREVEVVAGRRLEVSLEVTP